MQRTPLAKWLVVGALACFAFLAGATAASAQDSEAQGANTSSGAAGRSGPVVASNDANLSSGPSSDASNGSTSVTSMRGNTSATLDQDTAGSSGPATAGSQVSAPSQGSSGQNTNVSNGALATSGPVRVASSADLAAGPASSSSDPGSVAVTSQNGNANVGAQQVARGASGPSTAGSQVAAGGQGDAVTQGTNVASGSLSASGGVAVFNLLSAASGPVSDASDGGVAVTSQRGNTNAALLQEATGASGGATSGSQAFGSGAGDAQPTNSSSGAGALSGPVAVANLMTAGAGPFSSAQGAGSVSSTTHGGNAGVVGAQEAGGFSGNAVVGSQLIGLSPVEQGVLGMVNQQASDPDFFGLFAGGLTGLNQGSEVQNTNVSAGNLGMTGPVAAVNAAAATAGPGSAASTNADADPGANAAAGTATAITGMQGNALTVVDQDVLATSGDALVASQSASGAGAVSIQDTNAAFGMFGRSGAGVAVNAGSATSGPFAGAASSAQAQDTSDAAAGNAVAIATQAGNTTAGLVQGARSDSGDVTAGSQSSNAVSNALRSGTQNTNVAFLGAALSGPAVSANLGNVAAGSFSTAASVAAASDDATATSGNAISSVNRVGADDALLAQDARSASGDSSFGSQSTQLRASGIGLAEVGNTNVAAGGVSLSGAAGSLNVGESVAGAASAAQSSATAADTSSATADNATSVASQAGRNTVAGAQSAASTSGDAATSSQLTTANADSSIVRVRDTNVSGLAASSSGPALSANFGSWEAGPVAAALSNAQATDDGIVTVSDALATATQLGNNVGTWGQISTSLTGDAVAASQVTDIAAIRSIVDSRSANVGFASLASSGAAVSFGTLAGTSGPAALAASDGTAGAGEVIEIGQAVAPASQWGNNAAAVTQRNGAQSGDAHAASQRRDVRVNDTLIGIATLNASVGSLARSGVSGAGSSFEGAAGPLAVAAPDSAAAAVAIASQRGNNGLLVGQLADSLTGDAWAGSQSIAQRGSTPRLFLLANVTAGSFGSSAFGFGLNSAFGVAGPESLSTGGVAPVTQAGNNLIGAVQAVSAETGDGSAGTQFSGNAASTAWFDALGLDLLATAGILGMPAPQLGSTTADVEGEHAALFVPEGVQLA